MCRMICGFGNSNFALKEYIERLKYQALNGYHAPHKDGWGLIYSENDRLTEPYKKKESIDVDIAGVNEFKQIKTDFFIMHVRKSSVGVVSDKNSHPFLYKEFGFAHNGTIKNDYQLKEPTVTGCTDSEKLFHYIMNRIDKISMEEILTDILRKDLNATSLNFMMGNSQELFVFRYAYELEDYYTIYEGTINNGFIFSTEKFDNGNIAWKLLKNRSLIHIKKMNREEIQF